jgi:two-component system, NarL family, invasion response regulator UvrY
MNIIVVENHAFFRSLIHDTFDAGLPSSDIVLVETSETAMAEIERRHFDVAVIDISLPGENGFVLIQKIRQVSPDMKIIIYTQHNLPEYRDAAFEYGTDHFLSKKNKNPEDLVDLITTMTQLQ